MFIMARPLRIEYPGACYHVMNRGNQRMQVFHSRSHYELFLEKLILFSEQFHIKIRCYCLMSNHFHLYLETPEANLSRFMQSLLTSFTISLNRKRGKSGHLFQGRFKSYLVDDEAYGMVLSRYIHLNPLETETVKSRPIKEKLKILEGFPWSSCQYYLGKNVPTWLDTDHILAKFSKSTTGNPYYEYLKEGLRKKQDDLFESLQHQTFLGDDEFVEKIKRKYILDLNIKSKKDEKNLVCLQSSFGFGEVVKIAADIYQLSPEDVLKRRSQHTEARKFLIYCLWEFCRHSMSLSEMARNMGITQSGFSRSKGRFEPLLKEQEIQKRIKRFKKELKSIAGV